MVVRPVASRFVGIAIIFLNRCKQGETKTAQSYAKTMCTKFLEIEPALKRKINAYGEQTKHSMDRPELACQVKNLFRTLKNFFQVDRFSQSYSGTLPEEGKQPIVRPCG